MLSFAVLSVSSLVDRVMWKGRKRLPRDTIDHSLFECVLGIVGICAKGGIYADWRC